MKPAHVKAAFVLILFCCSVFGQAQQTVATNANVVVPTMMNFSGVLSGSNGKPLTSITGVTFSLYAEQAGGAPLWLETQNVQPDKNGNYTVQLGSTTSRGLPASLFVSGQARWLEVQVQGQEPQPRVMLQRAVCTEGRRRADAGRQASFGLCGGFGRQWCWPERRGQQCHHWHGYH